MWLFEIWPDWFSLSVISPTVSPNDWLIFGVYLYLSPAMIMLLFGLIKVHSLSKNGLFGFWNILTFEF